MLNKYGNSWKALQIELGQNWGGGFDRTTRTTPFDGHDHDRFYRSPPKKYRQSRIDCITIPVKNTAYNYNVAPRHIQSTFQEVSALRGHSFTMFTVHKNIETIFFLEQAKYDYPAMLNVLFDVKNSWTILSYARHAVVSRKSSEGTVHQVHNGQDRDSSHSKLGN